MASLGHASEFQRVSRLGSVTARHSSSRHEPNFAALNRGQGGHYVGYWPTFLVLLEFLFSLVKFTCVSSRRQRYGVTYRILINGVFNKSLKYTII